QAHVAGGEQRAGDLRGSTSFHVSVDIDVTVERAGIREVQLAGQQYLIGFDFGRRVAGVEVARHQHGRGTLDAVAVEDERAGCDRATADDHSPVGAAVHDRAFEVVDALDDRHATVFALAGRGERDGPRRAGEGDDVLRRRVV